MEIVNIIGICREEPECDECDDSYEDEYKEDCYEEENKDGRICFSLPSDFFHATPEETAALRSYYEREIKKHV